MDFHGLSGAREVRACTFRNGNVLKGMTLFSPNLISGEVRWDHRIELGHLGPNNLYQVELVRLMVGERTKQNAIHHGKDRRIRADPKRQRQHCYRREPGILPQHPEPIPQVVPQLFKR